MTEVEIATIANATIASNATLTISPLETCSYIFRRGASRGSTCVRSCKPGVLFCKKHNSQVLQVSNFPTHVMEVIVNAIKGEGDKATFSRLCKIGATCREYREIVNMRCKTLLDEQKLTDEQRGILAPLGPKRALHLLLESGCTKCGVPRITKVHWPFPLRLCVECIKQVTVPDFVLRDKYKLSSYNGVDRFLVCKGWNYYHGDSEYHRYLISDVEKDIGCTLHELEATIESRSLSHKMGIALYLGVPLVELCRAVHYMNVTQFPEKEVVALDYYRRLATEFCKGRGLERYNFRTEYGMINNINTPERYRLFLEYFENNADDIDARLKAQEFNKLRHQYGMTLQQLFSRDQYFSKCNMYNYIPAANTFDQCETEEELNEVFNNLKSEIKEFTRVNKLVLPFKEREAVRLARKMIFFPATTLTDPRHVEKWMVHWSGLVGLEVGQEEVQATNWNWNDAINNIVAFENANANANASL